MAAKSTSLCYDGLAMLRWNLANNANGTAHAPPLSSPMSQSAPIAQTDAKMIPESKRSDPALSPEEVDAEKLYSKFLQGDWSDKKNRDSMFEHNLNCFENFEPLECREARETFDARRSSKRGKYKTYDDAELLDAAKLVLEEQLSYSEVLAMFGHSFARSTLWNRVQHLKEGTLPQKSGRPTVLPASDERWLAAWAKLLFQLGVPVSRGKLLLKAKEIATIRGVKFEGRNGYPGNSWWRSFRKRHDLKLARTSHQAKAAAQSLTPEALDHFYTLLFSVMDKYKVKPELLFGADETGVSRARGDKLYVVCPGDARRVKQVGGESNLHITLLGAVNAVGHRLPPFVLRPGQGKRKSINYLEGYPKGSALVYTPKGWSNEDSFLQFVQWFVWMIDSQYKELRSKGEWAVLLVDRHSSRLNPEMLDYALEHRVHLVAYPTNATSLLQTLDVSVHGPFKTQVRNRIKELDDQGKSLSPVHVLTKVILPAWDAAFTPENIKSGFISTGIYPRDRSKIPPEKLQQAKLFVKTGRVVEHQGRQYNFSSESKSASSADSKSNEDVELLPMPAELKDKLDVPVLAKSKTKDGKEGGQRSRLLTEECFIKKVKSKKAESASKKKTKKTKKNKGKRAGRKRKRDESEDEATASDTDSDTDGAEYEGDSEEDAYSSSDDEEAPVTESKRTSNSSNASSLSLQPSNQPLVARTRKSTTQATEDSKAVPTVMREAKQSVPSEGKSTSDVFLLGECCKCAGKVDTGHNPLQDPLCGRLAHVNCVTARLRPKEGQPWYCPDCSKKVISKR